MSERTTIERFEAAVLLAISLPTPREIAKAIMTGSDEVDDGLRAASYDTDRISGGTSGSHPERMLAQRHPDQFPRDDQDQDVKGRWGAPSNRSADDLLRLSKASERAVDAIAALNAECCDAGVPDTWDEALHHANTLHEAGYLLAAIDVGRDVDAWALRFSFAVDDVRAVRDSWMPHAPAEGLAEENRAWCRPCQRLDIKRQRITKMCCQRCWRDVLDLEGFILDLHGAPIPAVELQLNPAYWPSEAMGRAREDGRRVLLDKEKRDWMLSLGVDIRAAYNQRQARRSG